MAQVLHPLNGRCSTKHVRSSEGLDVLDMIKRGEGRNGSVLGEPDRMVKVTVTD